jgi:hypothetical protein
MIRTTTAVKLPISRNAAASPSAGAKSVATNHTTPMTNQRHVVQTASAYRAQNQATVTQPAGSRVYRPVSTSRPWTPMPTAAGYRRLIATELLASPATTTWVTRAQPVARPRTTCSSAPTNSAAASQLSSRAGSRRARMGKP